MTTEYKPLTVRDTVEIDWEVFDNECLLAVNAMIDRYTSMGYDPKEVRKCAEKALRTCRGETR